MYSISSVQSSIILDTLQRDIKKKKTCLKPDVNTYLYIFFFMCKHKNES